MILEVTAIIGIDIEPSEEELQKITALFCEVLVAHGAGSAPDQAENPRSVVVAKILDDDGTNDRVIEQALTGARLAVIPIVNKEEGEENG